MGSHTNGELRCPDCGNVLNRTEEETFVCSNDETVWVLYSPKLLLRQPVVTRSVLELPWETKPAAVAA